jgi:hypothetical protein
LSSPINRQDIQKYIKKHLKPKKIAVYKGKKSSVNKNSDQLNKPIRRQGGLHKKDEEMFGDKYFGLLKFENEESYRYTKEGKYYRYEEYDKT